MVPIKIDISDFISEWNLTVEETDTLVSSILEEIGERFADSWRNKAGQELHQTKKEYQRGIYIERPDANSVVIGLKGWLPNAVEKGIEPFDMKSEGFSKSPKRKFKKGGGWYLTIPFRIGTPGIVAESSIFSTVMPASVHKVAKERLSSGRQKSLSVSDLPKEFQVKGVRPEVKNKITGQVFSEYQHKNPIFEGMQKSNKEGHSHYTTFRRVSDLSDPNSWIHTGIIAHNLMEKTLNDFPITQIISNAKEKFLKER